MSLTDTKVKNTRPSEKVVKLTDGFGLYLLVHPNGSKYWQLGYRFEGKQKVFSIGVYPAVSLADARQRRDEAKKAMTAYWLTSLTYDRTKTVRNYCHFSPNLVSA
ncbi:hypothetical protein A0E43_14885 [Pectobacterium cacticida]